MTLRGPRAPATDIAFAVTDTGIGIPAEALSADLRGVPAGRQQRDPRPQRDRARPRDQPPAGPAARGPHRGREPGGAGARPSRSASRRGSPARPRSGPSPPKPAPPARPRPGRDPSSCSRSMTIRTSSTCCRRTSPMPATRWSAPRAAQEGLRMARDAAAARDHARHHDAGHGRVAGAARAQDRSADPRHPGHPDLDRRPEGTRLPARRHRLHRQAVRAGGADRRPGRASPPTASASW